MPYHLCPPCRAAARAWEDYREPSTLKIAAGASRDDTSAGARDNRAARVTERRALIEQQLRLLRGICERKHGGG